MSFPQPESILPILTTIIGGGRFGSGLYSFISPTRTAQEQGIELSGASSAKALAKKTDSDHSDDSPRVQHDFRTLVYIHTIGTRHFVTGLSILSLTAYWQLAPECTASPIARLTAQRCVGVAMSAESLTAIVDAVLVWRYTAHLVPGTEMDLGKKGVKVHLLRALIWLGCGLWCLSYKST